MTADAGLRLAESCRFLLSVDFKNLRELLLGRGFRLVVIRRNIIVVVAYPVDKHMADAVHRVRMQISEIKSQVVADEVNHLTGRVVARRFCLECRIIENRNDLLVALSAQRLSDYRGHFLVLHVNRENKERELVK